MSGRRERPTHTEMFALQPSGGKIVHLCANTQSSMCARITQILISCLGLACLTGLCLRFLLTAILCSAVVEKANVWGHELLTEGVRE